MQDQESCVVIYSGVSQLPFSASADERLPLRIGLINPNDIQVTAFVGFTVGPRQGTQLGRFFRIPPQAIIRWETDHFTLERLLREYGGVPNPGQHVIIDWLAGYYHDDQHHITSYIRQKTIITPKYEPPPDEPPEKPPEEELPGWVIPVVGVTVGALGVILIAGRR